MPVWARNDLASVNISEAHGGCGNAHTRPAPGGVPVAVWKLDDCPLCENHLRHDPLWSATSVEVPETYDETKARERNEKTGKLDRENQMAEALVQLGKLGQLPEALGQMLAQLTGAPAPVALAGTMECANGHANAAGLKFCGECGTPMSQPVAAAALPAAEKAAEPPPVAVDIPSSGRLKDANKRSLQALCRAHGLDEAGTNADLITRVSNAGLTINSLIKLARQPVAA